MDELREWTSLCHLCFMLLGRSRLRELKIGKIKSADMNLISKKASQCEWKPSSKSRINAHALTPSAHTQLFSSLPNIQPSAAESPSAQKWKTQRKAPASRSSSECMEGVQRLNYDSVVESPAYLTSNRILGDCDSVAFGT